jgi:SNF2 family DNA or RNA helicase
MLYREYLKQKRPYQEFGHTFLLEQKHACLFYKPGKGKTYPTIDAIRDVDASMNGNAKVLILSTADAIKNMWNSEIVPQNILPKNTVLMTFNSAILDKNKINLMKIKWDIIVVDECHKIKSHNSKTSKLVYQLSKKAPYTFGLSGTPRGNSDIDIYCQFHNMNISDWGSISYTQFVDLCCDVEPQFFRGNHIKVPIGINKKYKAGWERNIAQFSQRVDYTDDDNMPDLDVNVIKLPYKETKEYRDAMDGVIQLSNYETTMTKLVAIMKAHQIVNGFLYYEDEDCKRKVHQISHNIKLDWLKDNLETNNVIVYRYDYDRQEILKFLELEGYTVTEIVDEFKQGIADILLLQCSRCESFNLQMCNRIIFYTLDYSYIKYNQMLHRIWRMGQKEQCEIVILTFENTVDEDIWDTVKNKEVLADLFMRIKGV